MANFKKMSDELKSFFAQEISASAVNVTTSINDTMNRKFDQLNNRLNEIDIRVNESKTLAENNTNRLELLEEESKITNLRLEEYSRKTEQLEELVDDQVNRNARSTLIIRGVKFNLQNEKSWNDTENVLATTLYIQFGWNKDQFAHGIERAHHGNYKNPNSPIYAKFLSWKVGQGVLEYIIKGNKGSKITIFASQKHSKKVQDRMNSQLLKRKEFKEDEVRKTWKSYVKFPGVLMVKKPKDKKYKVFDCDSSNAGL